MTARARFGITRFLGGSGGAGYGGMAFDRGETRVVRLCVTQRWRLFSLRPSVSDRARVGVQPAGARAVFPVGCMQLHRALKKQVASLAEGLTAAICARRGWPGRISPHRRVSARAEARNAGAGRLAAYVEEGASLCNTTILDDGLYLTTHGSPGKMLCAPERVHLDGDTQRAGPCRARAVRDYVLIGWDELPAIDRYQLIATDMESYDDSNRLNKMLYLCGRKSEKMKKRFRRF